MSLPIVWVVVLLSMSGNVEPFVFTNIYYTENGCWDAVVHKMPQYESNVKLQCVPYKPLLGD